MPEGKITNVRKRCARKSEAHFKKPKRNYRQSNEDQIEPGSHKEESRHNSEKSGQSQYHPQESKTDSSFAKEVVQLPRRYVTMLKFVTIRVLAAALSVVVNFIPFNFTSSAISLPQRWGSSNFLELPVGFDSAQILSSLSD